MTVCRLDRYDFTVQTLAASVSAVLCLTTGLPTQTCWTEIIIIIKIITSSVYDCTVEDVEYIYNKLSIHIFNSKSRRYLNVGITFP